MAKLRSNSYFNRNYLLALIPLVIIGVIFYYFSDIISYVLVGWVISMIGAPLVVFLRKYVGKNLAAGITLGCFVLLLVLLMYIFIPPLSKQARQLAGIDYTELINNLEEPIGDWEKWMADKGLIAMAETATHVESNHSSSEFVHTELVDIDSLLNTKTVNDSLVKNDNITLLIKIDGTHLMAEEEDAHQADQTFFEQAKSNIYEFLDPSLIPRLFRGVVGTLGNFMIALFSILFIAFFFLKEQGLFNNMISTIVPNKHERKTVQAIYESSNMLIRYFIGVLGQVTAITIFVSIALSILGVQNALLIGFFAALMNIIPYVGPIIGAMFAVIITISSNLGLPFYDEMLPLLGKVFIVFAIMQMLDNFILQPIIFGKSVKAHPLEIFIVVLVGANIGGIGGMVLAIPAYTVIRVVAKAFLSEFKVVQSLTRDL